MAAMLQGLGVASASVALSDYSVKISASSVHSLPVIRSEVRSSLGSINGSSRTGKAENPASVASKPGHELLLFEALGEGLEEEMDRDPRVCVMGEDVGHYGGSYKVTKGLAQKYGGHNSSCDPMTRRGRTPTRCRAFTEARGLFSVNPWNTDGCLFNPIQRQGSDEGCHPEGEPSGSF